MDAYGVLAFHDFRLDDDGPIPSVSNGSPQCAMFDFADVVPAWFHAATVEGGAFRPVNNATPARCGVGIACGFGPVGRVSFAHAGYEDCTLPTDGHVHGNLGVANQVGDGYLIHVVATEADSTVGFELRIIRDDSQAATPIASESIPEPEAGDIFALGWNGGDLTAYRNGEAVVTVFDDTHDWESMAGLALPCWQDYPGYRHGVLWAAALSTDTHYDPDTVTFATGWQMADALARIAALEAP